MITHIYIPKGQELASIYNFQIHIGGIPVWNIPFRILLHKSIVRIEDDYTIIELPKNLLSVDKNYKGIPLIHYGNITLLLVTDKCFCYEIIVNYRILNFNLGHPDYTYYGDCANMPIHQYVTINNFVSSDNVNFADISGFYIDSYEEIDNIRIIVNDVEDSHLQSYNIVKYTTNDIPTNLYFVALSTKYNDMAMNKNRYNSIEIKAYNGDRYVNNYKMTFCWNNKLRCVNGTVDIAKTEDEIFKNS